MYQTAQGSGPHGSGLHGSGGLWGHVVKLVALVAGTATLAMPAVSSSPAPAGASGGTVTITGSRPLLPSNGGFEALTERAPGADKCALDVARTQGLAIAQTLVSRTSSCAGGSFSAGLFLPANSTNAVEVYSVLAIAWWGGYEAHAFITLRVLAPYRVSGEGASAPAPSGGPPALRSFAGPPAIFLVSRLNVPLTGGTIILSYGSAAATSCWLSSVPQLWSGANPTRVRCEGRSALSIPGSSGARSWSVTFSATGSNGRTTTETRSLVQSAQMTTQSDNWSGYVVSSFFTVPYASGEWTVPRLDCSATPNSFVASWVGIGGAASNQELLQTGVSDQCVDGWQTDSPWWEMVPMNPNYAIDFTTFVVEPGDLMAASVYRDFDGAWTTRLDNLTRGWSGWMVTGEGWGVAQDGASEFGYQGTTTNLTYPGGTTAEWIVEAPTDASTGQLQSLADFGSETFSDLRTGLTLWTLAPQDASEIVSGTSVLSAPGLPVNDGFSVSYNAG
ncbi:MAG TPA: G1 family glutamic endopeptidase [Acidimicrobiales bacterium]|nr:G1 family glutamic endopeptidase [Acidimicrobiales bacterium]